MTRFCARWLFWTCIFIIWFVFLCRLCGLPFLGASTAPRDFPPESFLSNGTPAKATQLKQAKANMLSFAAHGQRLKPQAGPSALLSATFLPDLWISLPSLVDDVQSLIEIDRKKIRRTKKHKQKWSTICQFAKATWFDPSQLYSGCLPPVTAAPISASVPGVFVWPWPSFLQRSGRRNAPWLSCWSRFVVRFGATKTQKPALFACVF